MGRRRSAGAEVTLPNLSVATPSEAQALDEERRRLAAQIRREIKATKRRLAGIEARVRSSDLNLPRLDDRSAYYSLLTTHTTDTVNEWAFEGCVCRPPVQVNRRPDTILTASLVLGVRPLVGRHNLPSNWQRSKKVKPVTADGRYLGSPISFRVIAHGDIAEVVLRLQKGDHVIARGGITCTRSNRSRAGFKPRFVVQSIVVVARAAETDTSKPVDLADSAAVFGAMTSVHRLRRIANNSGGAPEPAP